MRNIISRMKNVGMVTFLLFSGISALAGIETANGRIATPYGGTPVVIGQPEAEVLINTTAATATHLDPSVTNLLTLGVDINYKQFFATAMTVKVDVLVTKYDESNTIIGSPYTESLEIQYDPFNPTGVYKDKSVVRFSGAYHLNLEIAQIWVNNVATTVLPANLFIDGDIFIERYYEFTNPSTALNFNTTKIQNGEHLVDTDCDFLTDEFEIEWNIIDGAEEYQLEWTFINDYDVNTNAFISPSTLSYDFRNNATRITTTDNKYTITNAFEHGYVIFRVRAVGRDINDLSKNIFGVWNTAENGTVSSAALYIGISNYNSSLPTTLQTVVHEANKNWQFSTTFAEEGKKKDVVSYFDGSLRNRQTVTKINTDNNTVVGETIYDHQGRPAVTVLPVPVTDPNCNTNNDEAAIKFYPEFNKNAIGTDEFSKVDFDLSTTNNCTLDATGMSTTSGASNYYSSSNPDKSGIQAYVPDAQTYPYTQVEYTPDNTGRIRRQSGVGEDFKLGSGHETKYFYGQPQQEQLDRLFGIEVGNAAHYKKNLVIDPNGQVSVSYLDQEGRVVATALAGDAPQNLEAIASESNAAVPFTVDLFSQDANGNSSTNAINPDQTSVEFTTQLLVATESDYVFNYSLNVAPFNDPCLKENICFNCIYDLEIYVRDECGNPLNAQVQKTVGRFNNGTSGIEFITECANPVNYSDNENFTLHLAPGNYTVHKSLTINEAARDFYVSAFLDPANNDCIKTLEDFEEEWLSQVDTTDCLISCDDCAASLGERDDFVSQGKGTALEYDLLMEQCYEPCKDVTICEATFQMLLADVSPGGQYAEFLTSSNTIQPGTFPLSVLNVNNQLPKNYATGGLAHWQKPVLVVNGNSYTEYHDEDGTRSLIPLTFNGSNYLPEVVNNTIGTFIITDANGQFYTYPENLLHVEDFIDYYAAHPYWANSLVSYHPEYCYYETCIGYGEKLNGADEFSSESFDALLIRTSSWDDAVTNEFIKFNYATINTIANRVENWFVTTGNHAWDPFVVYSANYDNYGTQLQNKFTNYYNDGVTNYSMPEFAAMVVRCGNNVGVTPNATCYRFGDDFVPGNTTLNNSIRDQEWNMLKSLYRSEKQKLINARGDEKAINNCDAYNGCIGETSFNPFSSGLFQPSGFGSWFNQPFYDQSQPCGIYTYQLYAGKVKRFANESDIPVQSAEDAAYQQYLLTGQCPTVTAFQSLIGAIAENNALDATAENMNAYPEAIAILLADNNFSISNPVPVIEWRLVAASSNSLKTELFNVNTNTTLCNFELVYSGTTPIVWDDVEGLVNMQSTNSSSPYTFSATLLLNTTNGIVQLPVTGLTGCANLADCRFEASCNANVFALDMQNLLTALAYHGDLTGTAVNLETATYAGTSPQTLLTATIRNQVGAAHSNLRWTYQSSDASFRLYDQSNSNIYLKMSIESVEPTSFNLSALNTIHHFNHMVSEWNNAYVIEGYDASNNLMVTIHGSVIHFDNGIIEPIAMGVCELPQPAACQGEGYDVIHDLNLLLKDVLIDPTANTNFNVYASVFWTSLLQNYLATGTTASSSVYSQVSNAGINTSVLEIDLNDCEMQITHEDNLVTPLNISDLVSITDLVSTGESDENGNQFEFYFVGTFATVNGNVTDTLFGSSCFPLRNCSPCPDSSSYQYDSSAVAEQDSILLAQGKTITNTSVIQYQEYAQAILDLNTNMGWQPSDSLFVTPMTYSVYAKEGMEFPANSYKRLLKHFDPDIDNYNLISNADSFTVLYGYGTNVKQEYKRYQKALQRYNQRAAAASLPLQTILPDTTFAIKNLADSLGYFIEYVEQMPQGSNTALDAESFLISMNALPALTGNECDSLYKIYVAAYHNFEIAQLTNPSCLNYEIYSPLYSLEDFKKNNLCCSVNGVTALEDYIALFSSSSLCPGALPKFESCTTVPPIDLSACQKLYIEYRQTRRDFNLSPWAQANSIQLPLLYETFDEFVRAGKCDCIEAWLKYMDTYLNAPSNANLPPVQSIDQYASCPEIFAAVGAEDCAGAFDQYQNCVAVYNQWALANHGVLIKETVKYETFLEEELCSCVDAYCSALNTISSGIETDLKKINILLSIFRVCDETTAVPCTPELPLNTQFVSPPSPYSNPCVEYMMNMALENAENEYHQYIDSVTNYIASRYTEHCLSAAETFKASYTDKEYHFTLYYYDQAGNLVKTVPPEGVELLPLDDNNPNVAALKAKINNDRTNHTQTVFTYHRMATQYEYNSLNQLVKQSMPDHDKMDVFEITLPNGLNAALETQSIQMVNSSLGYLSGNVGSRGYLYRTNDGGVTWTRVNDMVGATLKKIQMVNATFGYAVGTGGIVLKTSDGGSNWDVLTNVYALDVNDDLNDLHFINANEGVIVGNNSRILKTVNGGANFVAYQLPHPLGFFNRQHITSITHDGTQYFMSLDFGLTANGPRTGKVYRSTNGNSGTWNEESDQQGVSLADIFFYNNNDGYAAGVDGRLYVTGNSGTSWRLIATDFSFPIRKIAFSNDLEGVAMVETSAGINEIYATHDGGSTWQLLSAPGEDYNDMTVYYDQNTYGMKLAAVGENGLIQRIVMEENTAFGMIALNSPLASLDFTAVWADQLGGNVWMVITATNGNVYATSNGGDATVTWFNSFDASLITDPAIAIKARPFGGGGINKVISGTVLTQSGKLLSLHKAAGTWNYVFSAFTSPTSADIRDITLDVANDRVFGFDNTGKQAYKVQLTNAAVNTATLLPQTNAISQARTLEFNNGRLVVAGDNGEVFTGQLNPPANNIIAGGWQNRTNEYAVLPLREVSYDNAGTTLYAAGQNGEILKRNNSGVWQMLTDGMKENVNRIYFTEAQKAVVAGDHGLLSEGAFNGTQVQFNPYTVLNGNAENLHDVVVTTGVVKKAYVVGENGTVYYTPDLVNNHFAISNQQTNADFYGLALKPSTDQAYAIGEWSKIHWCMGASRSVVKNVFTPALKDVHFADANHGTVSGNNYTLRTTHDGGVTWNLIKSSNNNFGNKIINKVWTVDENYALAIGDNKYVSSIEGVVANEQPNTLISGTGGDLKSIAFSENSLTGYLGSSQRRLRSIILTPSGNSYTIAVNNLAQPTYATAGTNFNALWMFDNGSVLVAGDQNFISYYDGTAWIGSNLSLITAPNAVFKDIYFHDHLNGYVVGNDGVGLHPAGLIYRSKNASLTTNGFLSGITWDAKNLADGINVTSNANAQVNTIAFASRYNGVWGGKHAGTFTNTTAYPYVRLINDQSLLFSTYFYYDKLGRIVVSENTKQYAAAVSGGRRFSYTLYDELGRVIEAGEKTENSGSGSSSFADVFGTTIANYFNPKVIDDAKLNTWISDNSGSRKEVTRSYYDKTIITGLPITFTPNAETQRKRITHVTYEEVFDGNDQTYDHATHYDYDIHGNVKTLLQDNPKLAALSSQLASQRFKRMDYNYDLISGNVHSVSYQNNEPDQWHHAYDYDADNRITEVYTSNQTPLVTLAGSGAGGGSVINQVMDNHLWDRDAKYDYYDHGPLARVETGDNDVQGTDYVYTLQGWIKGVNSNTLDTNRDPGEDGLSPSGGGAGGGFNQFFAKDVYSYSLNYFTGDYQSIDAANQGVNSFTASITGSDVEANRHDLFNGNIGSMVTTITNPTTRQALPLGNSYKYDQLNRLLQAKSYNNLDANTNSFGTGGTEMYFNAFSYDANGNILTQVRNDDQNSTIDDMQYRYAKDANGKTIQNRLYHVNDDTDYDANDIDDMGLFDADLADINQNNNYSYTEIGELERDEQEEIDEIIWRVDSKVKEVHRSAGSSRKNLKFDYDAMGNRVAKHTYEINNTTLVKSTYYVRDAQGNVISVYEHTVDNTAQTLDYKLAEQHIYGSSRVGMNTKETSMLTTVTAQAYSRELGLKQYELSNHLGNVLTVITDKKIPMDDNTDQTVDYYVVEILSATDYSPFGVTLENRDFTSEKYRYGFNGMEKDDEVKGKGNSYTTEFRPYDSRLGRWTIIDPVFKPWMSRYEFASCNPIIFIDPNGDDDYYNERGQIVHSTATGNKSFLVSNNDLKVFEAAEAAAHKNNDDIACYEAHENMMKGAYEIQFNVNETQLKDLWNKSNPPTIDDNNTQNNPVENTAKEQNALIVLHIEKDSKGNITKAEVNLEVQSDSRNTIKGSSRAMRRNGGNEYTLSGDLVIGGFHTHPAAGYTINGVTYYNSPSLQSTDVSNFTNATRPQNFPEYTLDNYHYDKTIPNKTAGKYPSFKDDYKTAGSNFNIAKDALKTFGAQNTPEPKTTTNAASSSSTTPKK